MNEVRCGRNLLCRVINNLPLQLHLPGYQYCGLVTKLTKQLARGGPEINSLEAVCEGQDITYSQNREDVEASNVVDRLLAQKGS